MPAFGTLYQRLTLPESTRFTEARKNAARIQDEESIEELKKKANADPAVSEKVQPVNENSSSDGTQTPSDQSRPTTPPAAAPGHVKELATAKKQHFREFLHYFSEWRHLKVLIGTAYSWFALDVRARTSTV